MDDATARKRGRLTDTLRAYGSALVGYSGGVDSAYLAKAAVDVLGRERALAVTAISPSYPRVQREMARRVAREFDLPHLEIETEEWTDPRYVANPVNRCYFCKTELFERLCTLARDRGFAVVCDGANADDRMDYRPGARAARERAVRSPLQEAGLTKKEIRQLSGAEGLPTWDWPASPCLASRIPYGLAVTPERLAQIERAEEALRALRPWRHLRVRHHGEFARLELDPTDLPAFVDGGVRREVVRVFSDAGFDRALLDLEGYRPGSLNEGVAVRPRRRDSGPALSLPRLERYGPAGEVGVLALRAQAVDDLLGDSGSRAALARSKPQGVRFLTVELTLPPEDEAAANGGDAALRRTEPARG